ncbi:hypothetical protein T4D_480 [Trichinella pseudospiralis]|uniref:Uncharacterized protein n=1 Tax=Trichinella pseudospiralis TaxID=6337 RepID=A0A0V1FMC6_TRIPS|nr:hypothetical protein T4D_480 [Trichinella pseudospiralis]
MFRKNEKDENRKKKEFFCFEPTNHSYSNPDGTAQMPRTSRCVDWIRFSIDDSQATTPALSGLFEIIQSTIKLTLERPRGRAAVGQWNRFKKTDDLLFVGSLLAKVAMVYLCAFCCLPEKGCDALMMMMMMMMMIDRLLITWRSRCRQLIACFNENVAKLLLKFRFVIFESACTLSPILLLRHQQRFKLSNHVGLSLFSA